MIYRVESSQFLLLWLVVIVILIIVIVIEYPCTNNDITVSDKAWAREECGVEWFLYVAY